MKTLGLRELSGLLSILLSLSVFGYFLIYKDVYKVEEIPKDDTTIALQTSKDESAIKEIDTTSAKKSPSKILKSYEQENIFAERRNQIKETCKTLNLTPVSPVYELVPPRCQIGERDMFVYCHIPKTGTSFLSTYLSGIEKDVRLKEFRSLHTQAEVEVFLRKSVKFLFVREPYGRVFSAYVNKIYVPNPLYWNMGQEIIAATRDNPSNDSLKYGHDVTFSEYIKYLLMRFESGNFVDRHFAPMNTLCDPCRYTFDYFGKLETFASDAKFITEKIKEKNNNMSVNYVDFEKETAFVRVKERTKWLFKKLGATKDLKYPSYNFFLRVWRDLQIAGHLSKDIDMPISIDEQVLKPSKEEFINITMDALSRPMNQTLVKKQRSEALLQAYRSLPKEDLERLSKYVKKDCILFGYDERPRHIFDQSIATLPHQDTFKYFDAI